MSCLLWPAKTGTFFETKSKPKLWPRIDLAKIMAPMDSASRLVIGRWVISFNNWGQSHLTSWECFLWAFVEFFSFFFQPGALVPLVGEAGNKETLPGHLGLSSPHCHRLPWLPQLQVSLVFVVFVLCISEHFLTMGAVCKRLGKSEFIEVRNSSRIICAVFRLLFHLNPSAY